MGRRRSTALAHALDLNPFSSKDQGQNAALKHVVKAVALCQVDIGDLTLIVGKKASNSRIKSRPQISLELASKR